MALFQIYTKNKGTAMGGEITQSESKARMIVEKLKANGEEAWYEQIQ